MNLKKSGRTGMLIAAVAMLAMVLQGCGGGGGDDSAARDLAALNEAAMGQLGEGEEAYS